MTEGCPKDPIDVCLSVGRGLKSVFLQIERVSGLGSDFKVETERCSPRSPEPIRSCSACSRWAWLPNADALLLLTHPSEPAPQGILGPSVDGWKAVCSYKSYVARWLPVTEYCS